jgi:1-acyl-sn-glycerol-3-phosphate acyltransferase
MAFLRSCLFALFFYPGTVVAVLMAIAVAPFGTRAVQAVTVGWARYHRLCATWLLGIRTLVEGTRPTGPAIVAIKHQSMYETLEIILLLDLPAVVMKRELTRIPLWGWVTLKYGIIAVDREAGAGALRQLLKDGRAAVEQGRPIAIFPEGTRVAPGDQPPLQPGFAGLYRTLKLPVVPLALNSGRLWPRNSFVKRPGIVTMRYGEPIPPGVPRDEIEARVHHAINALEREPAA